METKSSAQVREPEVAATSREHRRLALLKRSGLFQTKLLGVQFSRAMSLDHLEQAYRLVHEVFLDAGYINPYPSGMRIRKYEACPETGTFIAESAGRVVGVISLVLDSPDMGLPTDGAFGSELDSLRERGIRLCEATNQAIAPLYRKTAVATELMRCAAAQTWLEERDIAVVAVSPQHRSFYELLSFQVLTDVRSYSDEVDDPVIMMYLDMQRLRRKDPTLDPVQSYIRDFLAFTNPFVRLVEEWKAPAMEAFRDTHMLRELFLTGTRLLQTCSDADRRAIRDRWGEQVYAEVLGLDGDSIDGAPARYVPVATAQRIGRGKLLRPVASSQAMRQVKS